MSSSPSSPPDSAAETPAERCRVAVFFGGRSVEHDVSILTGLQALEALDPTRFDGFPVYIDPAGQWWTGDALRDRNFYPLTARKTGSLTAVALDLACSMPAQLRVQPSGRGGLFGRKAEPAIAFDVALPALHGSNGEDGTFAGLLDFAGVIYTGSPPMGAATAMHKAATKRLAAALDIPVLAHALVLAPAAGTYLDGAALEAEVKAALGAAFGYPLIVKPLTLGSSIGVARADGADALLAAVTAALRFDDRVMVEPCITPLREYNIAVRRAADGSVKLSAIERPDGGEVVLDFKQKYRGGQEPGTPKAAGSQSEGMASAGRTLNPDELSTAQRDSIHRSAAVIFDALELAGSVRIDFLAHAQSGDIWLNEVNPIPGSFAYFLWEAAEEPLGFLALTAAMIDEAQARGARRRRSTDAALGGGQLFSERKS